RAGFGDGPLPAPAPLGEPGGGTDRLERPLRFFAPRLEQIGRAVPMMAAAVARHAAGVQQIVIVDPAPGAPSLVEAIRREYLPFAITLRVDVENKRRLAGSVPFVAAMEPVGGASAAYVCHHFTCRQPVTT